MVTHVSLSKHVHLQHVALQLHLAQASLSGCLILYFIFLQYSEQRRQRPTLQPYRTEARRRSRWQRNWKKAWRLSRPMTPPPHLLLRPPNHKAAPRRGHPPSPHPRRKRSSSRRRSWKRARSRRRRRRPEELRHTRPRWNTTVKHFLVYDGVADELTTSDLFKHFQLRCHPPTRCTKLTLEYLTVLRYTGTHLVWSMWWFILSRLKTLIITFTYYLTQVGRNILTHYFLWQTHTHGVPVLLMSYFHLLCYQSVTQLHCIGSQTCFFLKLGLVVWSCALANVSYHFFNPHLCKTQWKFKFRWIMHPAPFTYRHLPYVYWHSSMSHLSIIIGIF